MMILIVPLQTPASKLKLACFSKININVMLLERAQFCLCEPIKKTVCQKIFHNITCSKPFLPSLQT